MRTIRHYIDMRADEEPDKIFMFAPEPNLTLTYAQLQYDSIELGKYLYRKGLQKGDKISFMLGNGYQTTKIFLGGMYAGLVVAPLNLMSQPSQLEYVMIDSAGISVVIRGNQHYFHSVIDLYRCSAS